MSVRVAALSKLWKGDMSGCVIGRTKVLLVRLDDGVFAYEDKCAHLGMPLSEGSLTGCVLTCRAHRWEYDARTGLGLNPKGARLRALPVRIEGDDVLVDVEER
jgi:nitrite reductase/ring-hydroxylating ferredoxin subunit